MPSLFGNNKKVKKSLKDNVVDAESSTLFMDCKRIDWLTTNMHGANARKMYERGHGKAPGSKIHSSDTLKS